MGAADVVPGVSGGTVALVLGIYERLVSAIRDAVAAAAALVRRDAPELRRRLRAVPWVWVLSLLAGIGLAIVLLAPVLEQLLEERPQAMAGLFLGLILGSVVVSWRLVDRVSWRLVGVMGLVALVFFLLLGLQETTQAYGAETVARPWWAFLLAGALAICAMILPGVSGSFVLVLLGMYAEVIGAVNGRDLAALAVFAVGCVVGLAAFSTVLGWLLDHHRSTTLAVLIGLMLGSTRILWPWPDGLGSTILGPPAGDTVLVPVILAVVGLLAVLAVEAVGARAGAARHRR